METLIVHEWIARHGGSENVVQCMAEAYPDADIFCLWNEADRFARNRVAESWIAKTPLRRSKALALPFMPATWRGVNIDKYDSVLVSSHLFAHHVGRATARREANIHVYVHTPARYIWAPELDARAKGHLGRFVTPVLKGVDRRRAADGARFAANSRFIQQRIAAAWDQPSEVIYPPVSIEKLRSQESWADVLTPKEESALQMLPEEFVLGASRFVPYKNLSKVIEVGEAVGLPVVLAGAGPDSDQLRARAEVSEVPVTFIDSPSNALLYALYQAAILYVFPPVEDFGIMPVEAMALGTPALVNAIGGAAESVRLLDGGAMMVDGGRSELRRSVESALGKDMKKAASAAAAFSEQAFIQNILAWTAGEDSGT